LRSGTTQRSGYVQLMDIGPTMLDLAGVGRPESMRGRPVEVGERRGNAEQRRAFLVDGNNAATFRVRIASSVPNLYVWLTSLLVVATLVVFWRPRYRMLRAVLPWAAFALLGYLATVYLARLFPFHDVGILAYWLFVIGGAIALGVLFCLSGRGRDLDAVMGGLAFLVALLVADVVLDNRLQFNSALGFSPSVAGRFVGFGNSGYAVLASAALLLAALVAHRVGGRRGAWCAIGVLGVAFVADAAPFWGADVGGLLSMVPAYGITAVLLLGIRVRLRTVMVFVGAAVAALAAATVLDLQQSSGDRRHLGRLIEQIDAEGVSALSDVIGRKVSQNLTSLQTSSFRILVLIGGAFVAYLVFSRPPQFVRLLERVPELRAALIGFGVLAVLGYGLNDTGVAVPGLMIGVLVCSLVPLLCVGTAPAHADAPADITMVRA